MRMEFEDKLVTLSNFPSKILITKMIVHKILLAIRYYLISRLLISVSRTNQVFLQLISGDGDCDDDDERDEHGVDDGGVVCARGASGDDGDDDVQSSFFFSGAYKASSICGGVAWHVSDTNVGSYGVLCPK